MERIASHTPGQAVEQVGLVPGDARPSLAVASCDRECVGAPIRACDAQVGALVGEREGDRPAPGRQVEDPGAGGQLEADLDEMLGLGTGDQDARVDGQLDPAKAAPAEDVGDRLAEDRPAADEVTGSRGRRRRSTGASG